MTKHIVIMLSRLTLKSEPVLTLRDFELDYEPLPSETKQIRRWRRIAGNVGRRAKP